MSRGKPARSAASPARRTTSGELRCEGVQGIVRGQVVDSEGQPVTDARVFNSGDAPARLETRSDPQGRFRLEGLRTGPVAIIAEKSGRSFAGVRAETGKEDLLIQLNAEAARGRLGCQPDRQSADVGEGTPNAGSVDA